MLHIVSTLVIGLLITGLLLRGRPAVHPKLMITAFTLDVLLVLYIEFTRGAVERVLSDFGPLLWFHAAVSLVVLFAYVGMAVLGRRLLRGDLAGSVHHRNLGIAFCILRSLNYVTSYLV